jgi:DNA-binding CsgD family transcriptional regulator
MAATRRVPVSSSLPWPGKSSGLTERESEVIALVAAGLTNQEIADRLFLSRETIKSYVGSIFSKLEIRNRVEASRFVHRSGEFDDSIAASG